jgi:hypothetical protein
LEFVVKPYKAIEDGLEEGAHLKVEPLVDDGTDLGVGRVEGAVLAVSVDLEPI